MQNCGQIRGAEASLNSPFVSDGDQTDDQGIRSQPSPNRTKFTSPTKSTCTCDSCRNHALTLEDIERYDIFILHPACLADRAKKVKKGKNGDKEGNEGGKGKEKVVDDEPNTSELFSSDSVRTAFMKAIGVVLVDEGDFGTVKTR